MPDEELEKKLIQRAIDEQDMLAYFSYAYISEDLGWEGIDEEFTQAYGLSGFGDFLAEHPEVIKNWTMNNLVFALGSGNEMVIKQSRELIIEKLRNGEHVFSGGNAEFQFLGPPMNAWRNVFGKIGIDTLSELQKTIIDNLEKLKEKDPKVYEFVNKLRGYAGIDSFLSSYDEGNITPKKLDYLERVYEQNPNIIENMSFALMKDEIFEMGEDFVTRIARYPNMSTKLIKLLNISPEVFNKVKEGFMDLEKNSNKPAALEIEKATLTYALKHFKEVKDLSFEEMANLGIGETSAIKIKVSSGYVRFDSNKMKDTPIEAVNAKYKLIDEFAKTYIDVLRNTQRKIEEEKDIEYREINGKLIKKINLHEDFNLLTYSSDSGFKEEKVIIDDDFKKTWNERQDVSVHQIPCCFINQDFLGQVPVGKNGILAVFTDLKSEDISTMGPMDINSHIRSYNSDAGRAVYMSAEELSQNSRRVYSEVPIEMKQPDFLLIFDDTPEEVLNNTYKAAADFGVDILYIDKREVEQKQIQNLDRMIAEFRETEDLEVLQKLLSMYETNVAGWLLNRGKSEDRSLTSGINNERFREDFEKMGSQIYDLIQNYIDEKSGRPEYQENLRGVFQILEDEVYKYEFQNEERLNISYTFPSIDYKAIISKLERVSIIKEADTSSIAPSTIDLQSLALNSVIRDGLGLSDLQALKIENKEQEVSNRVPEDIDNQGENR